LKVTAGEERERVRCSIQRYLKCESAKLAAGKIAPQRVKVMLLETDLRNAMAFL
jgi:hypothetical protein